MGFDVLTINTSPLDAVAILNRLKNDSKQSVKFKAN